jgi:hypothetical protein
MRLNPREDDVKEKYKMLGLGPKKALGIVARGLLFEIVCET